jgi:uncharacterized cupredoxin-like copper-binding protein
MVRPLLLLNLITGLLVMGCTAQAAPAVTDSEPTVLRLTMHDHYFEPTALRFTTGQRIQLEIVNVGLVEHDLLIGMELERYRWDQQTLVNDFFKGVQLKHSEQRGRLNAGPQQNTSLKLEVGGKATLVFTVPTDRAGAWEFGCFVTGHYEAGMKGTLTVE